MAKWEPEDLTKLDLRIIIGRLRGIYRNAQGPVTYQPSLIELEAARRLERCLHLLMSKIDTDLALEMAKAAYEAACKDANVPAAWVDVTSSHKAAWVVGVGAGVVKFLSSLNEGGDADGIMGSQSEKVSGHEMGSEATGEMPVQPLTGL